MYKFLKLLAYNLFFIFLLLPHSFGEIINKIEIFGNSRISKETIKTFSQINIGDNIANSDLNIILKSLNDSNFFENISVDFTNGVFTINVVEAPIIQNIIIRGIKAKKIKKEILSNTVLKPRSSFNNIFLTSDIESIQSTLKSMGYYFSDIETSLKKLDENLIDIIYDVDIGDKSKISKISFLGDKIYKDRKLKNIIISEEYKFWKFISGKKYLNEQLIQFDTRLLKNFYLNNGYYNVIVNSTFAKLTNDNEFELVFNIQPGKRIYFNDLVVTLPGDFEKTNYSSLTKLFKDIKNQPYSINTVDKILDQIDTITTNNEFKSINANVNEQIDNNRLNIEFTIQETEKYFVEKINIYGNNVTRESVIRNKLEIDEGDPFNDILSNKSTNNLKSLNFFEDVSTKVTEGNQQNSKIIDITVKEKATGEIMAGAGAGSSGSSVFFGVKENNYLGKGMAVDANATISDTSFKGKLSLTNPNYNNSDKTVFVNLQAIEIDQLKKYGYKTTKNGIELGTSFEYLDDFNFGLSSSSFVEKIETNSTASVRQKKQAGNYFDTFIGLNFNYDKRNQKFKTTDGYISYYDIKLPVVSDTNTLTNSYKYKVFSELYENNISSFSILLKNTTSITNEDVKLTERLTIPSSNLRGFELGKVGPKDGGDFIGGNYISAINLQSSLPLLFENSQSLDAIIFFDAANVWGVDYDSSIDDSNKIRSSIGLGVDWLTIIGPLSFSLSEVISKHNNDVEETFRFNLGTTF